VLHRRAGDLARVRRDLADRAFDRRNEGADHALRGARDLAASWEARELAGRRTAVALSSVPIAVPPSETRLSAKGSATSIDA
jgi:hypothetical protein